MKSYEFIEKDSDLAKNDPIFSNNVDFQVWTIDILINAHYMLLHEWIETLIIIGCFSVKYHRVTDLTRLESTLNLIQIGPL